MPKSPMAPARIVGNARASFKSPAGTTSGVFGSSRGQAPAIKLSTATPPTAPRRRATKFFERVMGPFLRSEGNIDAADPVPHRGLREEGGLGEVVWAPLVELRVEAIVFRPSRRVAPRDREAQRGGPEQLHDS